MLETDEQEEEEKEEAPRRTWNGAANGSFSRHLLCPYQLHHPISIFNISKVNFDENTITKSIDILSARLYL